MCLQRGEIMHVLITGGTGTLGQELVKQLYRVATKITVYSRSESRQADMQRTWPIYPDNKLQYVIGDVRDEDKLIEAMRTVTHVIHTAALKRIETCEYNIEECMKTNILGTMNVVKACNKNKVKKCLVVSTDKAVSPINAYGASKLMSEKIAIAANNLGPCHFACVRYGNVMGSKGSVMELWRKQKEEGKPLTVTDKEMTRFWIEIEEAAKFIIHKFEIMERGCIYIPKIKKSNVLAEAKAISPKIQMIQRRPGEKTDEELIHKYENCYEWENYYIIYPIWHEWIEKMNYMGEHKPNFHLTSKSV